MYKCNCGKEFNKQSSLNSHARFCKLYEKKKKKTKYKVGDKYVCECGKEFVNHQSLNAHFSHCLIHRNGKPAISNRNGGGWSKGYTKETNEYVAKMSETLISRYKSGDIQRIGCSHTDETKRLLSQKRISYMESHGNYGLKWYEVNNGTDIIKVQGSWEFIVANWLNRNSIKWNRIKLKYKNRTYTPDFYLSDLNVYLEVKGWMKDRDIYKMYEVLKEHDITIRLIEAIEIKNINNLTINDLPLFTEKYNINDIDFSKFKIRY